jgi:hypothetical protein
MGLVDAYLPVKAALEQRKADPLAHWRFAVDRVREAARLFTGPDPIDELHLRACNKGGKTSTVAALVLACLQKREHLDGVPLPQWRGPLEAAQLVLDYKQQLLSVQPAYLRLLGSWPHHARYTGEILSSLSVKPLGASDHENEWSVLHFLSQENKRTGVGVRGDVIAFDEPPVIDILRELRKAAHAGRRSLILIGETPTVRREWWPLREDYGETLRRSIRRVDRERAEVRWSLDEVADWVLSPEEKDKLRRKYRTDPLRDAREHGDYINAVGECPFDAETLLQLLEECRDPNIVEWRVSIESLAGERATQVARVPVEIFGSPEPGAEYYGCIDPASGVDDHKHNPAGLHLRAVGSGDLVVRWNGYLAPYSVGVLGAGLGRQYNNARFDVEMKDHWGVNVVRGFTASRYGRLCHEERELRPGEWAKEVGFDNNEETRAAIIGCVQEWLEARRAGVRYANCPSRKIIECLLDCQLDERGKIVAGATGTDHGEDLILWGQGLRKAVSRSNRAIPEVHRPKETPEQRLIREIRGEAVEDDEAPFDQVAVRPRVRRGF